MLNPVCSTGLSQRCATVCCCLYGRRTLNDHMACACTVASHTPFSVEQIVAEAHTAFVTCTCEVTVKASGQTVSCLCCHQIQLDQEGKIVLFVSAMPTAAATAAVPSLTFSVDRSASGWIP